MSVARGCEYPNGDRRVVGRGPFERLSTEHVLGEIVRMVLVLNELPREAAQKIRVVSEAGA